MLQAADQIEKEEFYIKENKKRKKFWKNLFG
jgi:hypothetical protein